MGKCKFQQKWLEDGQFKTWLKSVDGQPGDAFRTVCKKLFKLGTLKSHMQSESHKSMSNVKGMKQLNVVHFFCRDQQRNF